ncbi:unnamed protein product [Polarella glacialis]|uniref:Uncharacterized protein n=1 Tax=Polarella glacialis TaxID=89957 RepID=A0A813HLW0_POLGL|nr:unnamed protein product [Polarella glacialis]
MSFVPQELDLTEMGLAGLAGQAQPFRRQEASSSELQGAVGQLKRQLKRQETPTTPMSEPSTAPCTPTLGYHMPGSMAGEMSDWEEDHSFCRQMSIAEEPETLYEEQQDKLERMLAEVKDLYKQKYGHEVDEEEKSGSEFDQDGTLWIETKGTGIPTDSRQEKLEQMLAEVKDLYKQKFGKDVDEDSADVCEYDQDGTLWIETKGTGIPTDSRQEKLEQMLTEVKGLYKQAYIKDVDEVFAHGYEYDEDDTLWIETKGTGIPTDSRQEKLKQMLAEVKGLYKQKYGEDVDEDSADGSEDDQDGTLWIEAKGTGTPTDSRPEKPEQMLAEVTGLYKQECGHDVDEEEKDGDYDEDGTLWIWTVGSGISAA